MNVEVSNARKRQWEKQEEIKNKKIFYFITWIGNGEEESDYDKWKELKEGDVFKADSFNWIYITSGHPLLKFRSWSVYSKTSCAGGLLVYEVEIQKGVNARQLNDYHTWIVREVVIKRRIGKKSPEFKPQKIIETVRTFNEHPCIFAEAVMLLGKKHLDVLVDLATCYKGCSTRDFYGKATEIVLDMLDPTQHLDYLVKLAKHGSYYTNKEAIKKILSLSNVSTNVLIDILKNDNHGVISVYHDDLDVLGRIDCDKYSKDLFDIALNSCVDEQTRKWSIRKLHPDKHKNLLRDIALKNLNPYSATAVKHLTDMKIVDEVLRKVPALGEAARYADHPWW